MSLIIWLCGEFCKNSNMLSNPGNKSVNIGVAPLTFDTLQKKTQKNKCATDIKILTLLFFPEKFGPSFPTNPWSTKHQKNCKWYLPFFVAVFLSKGQNIGRPSRAIKHHDRYSWMGWDVCQYCSYCRGSSLYDYTHHRYSLFCKEMKRKKEWAKVRMTFWVKSASSRDYELLKSFKIQQWVSLMTTTVMFVNNLFHFPLIFFSIICTLLLIFHSHVCHVLPFFFSCSLQCTYTVTLSLPSK